MVLAHDFPQSKIPTGFDVYRQAGFFMGVDMGLLYGQRAKTAERGYGGKWQRARLAYLQAHPLCVACEARGIARAAQVVDHVVPHRGDLVLFWDQENWQSLCKPCHDSSKQRLEKSGRVEGCDANGLPLDGGHHWMREGG